MAIASDTTTSATAEVDVARLAGWHSPARYALLLPRTCASHRRHCHALNHIVRRLEPRAAFCGTDVRAEVDPCGRACHQLGPAMDERLEAQMPKLVAARRDERRRSRGAGRGQRAH